MKEDNSIPNFTFTLTEEEEARWLCLIERVNFLFDKMETLHGDVEINLSDKKMARKVHKALVGYINDRYNAMLWDVHCANKQNKYIL